LLLGYCAGELTAGEERALFQAAAHNQDLFDQLMEAEAVRHALGFPEERQRGERGAAGSRKLESIHLCWW
jgi:hypothetical protein